MKHPRHQVLVKFLLLSAVLLSYFVYLTYQFDLLTGGFAALITWSFFLLCTPVADAGFLLDLPQRLLFGIRMVLSEIAVWGIGTFLSIRFGDELMDVLHHEHRIFYLRHHFKHEMLLLVFFALVILGYYEMVSTLGISIEGN